MLTVNDPTLVSRRYLHSNEIHSFRYFLTDVATSHILLRSNRTCVSHNFSSEIKKSLSGYLSTILALGEWKQTKFQHFKYKFAKWLSLRHTNIEITSC